ncbi:MAG: AtpZ/AtpI family protein [Phycisphaerales bacterium]
MPSSAGQPGDPTDTANPEPELPPAGTPPPIPQSLLDPVARPASMRTSAGSAAPLAGQGKAWGIASDFIGTLLGGTALGWGIDLWRGTLPWFLLGGLALGFFLAMFRIVRRMKADERAGR